MCRDHLPTFVTGAEHMTREAWRLQIKFCDDREEPTFDGLDRWCQTQD